MIRLHLYLQYFYKKISLFPLEMQRMLFMLVMVMTMMAIGSAWSFRGVEEEWAEEVLVGVVEAAVAAAAEEEVVGVVGLLEVDMDPHPDVQSTE